MSGLLETDWLNLLIGLLQRSQLQLLRILDALGLVDHLHGQAAWPWPLRMSGENLLLDLGQARRLGLTLITLAAALCIFGVGLFWRRGRIALMATAVLLLAVAPWPEANVVWVPAHPTSFHQSPTGFAADSIERGRALYAAQCVGCHGADGRGQGTLSASLPVWPPNLAGPLLWRRADGDLLWHVLEGVRDRRGARTMPGFGGVLSDADAWSLIDFMKAQGAGESLREAGLWTQPVAPPDVAVQCSGKAPRNLGSWRGQRLRIVAAGANGAGGAGGAGDAAGTAPALREDPRLVTVFLLPPTASRATSTTPGPMPSPGDCVVDSAAAWAAFSLIAASDRLAGTQLIVDRSGWLRARSQPGQGAWRDDDLLCRTEGTGRTPEGPAPADGLGALIARMDAEPVRFVKGGFVH